MEAKEPGVWATREGKKQFLASFFWIKISAILYVI